MDNSPKYTNQISISHWNASGLSAHLKELKQCIIDHKIDVMLVSETHYKEEKQIKKIENFDCFFKNREAEHAGGGVLVYVKKALHGSEIQCSLPNKKIEVVGVKIKKLSIYSIYAPDATLDNNTLNKLFNSNHQVLIGGDFNAKHRQWSCNRANQNGTALKNYLENRPYVLIPPDGHTHYPLNGNSPSTIDLTVVKNIKNIKLELIHELDSDHLPTLAIINSKTRVHKNQTFLNYKKANWKNFKSELQDKHKIEYKLDTIEKIDIAVKNVTKSIQKAIKHNIPKTKIEIRSEQLNSEIRNIICERNALRKKFQKTNNPKIKARKNELSRKIRKLTYEQITNPGKIS